MNIKRICPGLYEATENGYKVIIDYLPHIKEWVARADWDQYRYSDPVPTYKEAKAQARMMLETAEEF